MEMTKSTSIEQENTNSSDEIVESLMVNNKNKRKYGVAILGGILCIGVIVTVILMNVFGVFLNNNNMNKDDALFVMDNLMNNTNFSDSDYDLFQEAVGTFDENDDGYLNKTEFTNYFKLEIEYWSVFDKIDADTDDILSFPEIVAYIHEIWKIQQVRDMMINAMSPIIEIEYKYKYNTSGNTIEDNLFLEYIAILSYFMPFDIDSNGYIQHDEYLNTSSEIEFYDVDSDKNGQINYNEFFNLLYGDDDDSWNGKMMNIFGDDYKSVMDQLKNINITPEMVQSIKINSCSNIFNKDYNTLQNVENKRRRLVYCYPILICWGPICVPLCF